MFKQILTICLVLSMAITCAAASIQRQGTGNSTGHRTIHSTPSRPPTQRPTQPNRPHEISGRERDRDRNRRLPSQTYRTYYGYQHPYYGHVFIWYGPPYYINSIFVVNGTEFLVIDVWPADCSGAYQYYIVLEDDGYYLVCPGHPYFHVAVVIV